MSHGGMADMPIFIFISQAVSEIRPCEIFLK